MVEAPARSRIPLLIALAVPAAWFLALITLKNEIPVADERIHASAIRDFAAGSRPPEGYLAMPPGFHWLASWPARIFGPSLTVARAVSLLFTLAALVLLHDTARRLRAEGAATAALRFALFPIALPLSAMVYTEPAALLGLSLTLWLFFRGRRNAAYAAAAASCAVRQSSLAWIVLLAVLEFIEWRRGGQSVESFGDASQRGVATTLPAIFVRAGATVVLTLAALLATGGINRGPATENRVAFNPAQLYLAVVVAVTAFAPLWITGLWNARRLFTAHVLPRPLLVGVAAACVGVFALEFQNPHPWNNDPSYFRNRVLIALYGSMGLRLALGALAVAAAAGFWAILPPPPRREAVVAAMAVGGLYLAVHWLADPRYGLPIVMLYTLLQPLPRRVEAAQVAWLALLGAAAGAMVLRFGVPSGGMF
jgi:hypothetical protein